MAPSLTVRVIPAGKEIQVVVSGDIDLSSVEDLRGAIEPVLGPNQMIVFDLSGVTFADSSLLHVLATARSEVGDGNLLVRNPSTIARRLLTIGEMTDLLDAEVDRQGD